MGIILSKSNFEFSCHCTLSFLVIVWITPRFWNVNFVFGLQVQRDARIGEAEARRDAGIKEAIAEEQRMQARYSNDIEIAQSKRDFELKKAAYDMEVQTKKAEADLAYSLQVCTCE